MQLHIERREWLWVILFAACVLLLTCLPYWLGWSRGSSDRTFGGFIYGIEDDHSYIGKMRLGARGELGFSLFYTSEVHSAEPLIFLPYILPGWVVGHFISPIDPALTPALIGVFHLMRILFSALLIGVIYLFTAAFLDKPNERRLATFLAVAAGGLGWLLVLTGNSDPSGALPPEFYIPEGFTWLILLGIPHLALARAALLGGLLLLIMAAYRDRWLIWSVGSALCWGVMALSVPFYLPIVYCIVGVWGLACLIRNRRFPTKLFIRAVTACALTLPLFAYYAYVFASNQAFAVWSAQNDLPSPPLIDYVLAYGLIALLAVLALRRVWQNPNMHYRLLVGWIIIVPLLVYLPLNVQRRMSEGVIVPLAILAAITLVKTPRAIRIPAFATLAASSALLLLFALVTGGSTNNATVFPSTSQIAAFNWLAAHGERNSVILSAVSTGNALPAYTDLRTFMGHGPETLYWREKTDQLQHFYRGELSPQERETLLHHPCAPSFECVGAVRYVFYGEAERLLTAPDDPVWTQDTGISLIYESAGVQIYQYEPPTG